MSGLAYRKTFDGWANAPKGKLPYIEDEETIVADSTFILFHLKDKYGIDFDHGLEDTQSASAWAAERLAEDHLYWAMVHSRCAIGVNFQRGPAHLFDNLPEEIQDQARQKQRKVVISYLDGQRFGRHTPEEIGELARHGYEALSRILGDNEFLMGARPCGADAGIFGQIMSALSPVFGSLLSVVERPRIRTSLGTAAG